MVSRQDVSAMEKLGEHPVSSPGIMTVEKMIEVDRHRTAGIACGIQRSLLEHVVQATTNPSVGLACEWRPPSEVHDDRREGSNAESDDDPLRESTNGR
jgi:hypothetical protein